ncbi:hemerythrin domain-containing protein [Burkholderia cenocepacia]|uniref:hemerythrin domain-containing protein n=1 Tax=Burkholderia cenocepacia TaxID=95486 RepID=UPI0019059D14|nr:hemerythrin domain-containing protein [Burkholderia cenocepacia]MBJ9696821.1 hemerythrin domain-containing protein [Burkholderia cenocepacia]
MKSDSLLLIKPAPSFDEPVEMLEACHERIAAECATLMKLAAHLPSHGADTQAQQAARNIMRYFDIAAPHHHADEEQDLFPVLVEISQHQCSPVGERIASLLDEHRALEASWTQLRTVLADIAEGKTRLLEPVGVSDFAGAYRAHIAQEESQIFPFAEACLDRQQLVRLSAAMVARRTITTVTPQ